jgi:hypothetical protein
MFACCLFADAPEELRVDFMASQEAARNWKVRSAACLLLQPLL